MATIETTLGQLLTSYDWEEAFGEGSGGNTDRAVSLVVPGSTASTAPVSRADVVEIVAAVNGENDGADWLGLFRLNDGRYLIVTAGCDYTGWDCRAYNAMEVASSLDEAIRFGLTDAERLRLGLAESERPETVQG